MSTKIQFPNNRLTHTGLGNPLFVTDVENNTQNLLLAINMLLGLPANGFAILEGLTYQSGSYTPGTVYMNGVIYACVSGVNENKYLAPDPTDVDSKLHSDGNSYMTYRIYYAVESSSPVGGMPQFVGNMNAYRLDLTKVNDRILALIAALGSAAYRTVGSLEDNLLPLRDTLGFDGVLLYDDDNNAMYVNSVENAFNKAFGTTSGTVADGAAPGTAQSNAEATAAGDATSKANTAQSNAESYALNTVAGGLLTTVIEIGDWNLTTTFKDITHGLDFTKIKNISCVIRDDANANRYILPAMTSLMHIAVGVSRCNSTTIQLLSNSYFNDLAGNYVATSYNRGWITIQYLP